MLLNIRLQLLEYLLQSLDPIHIPAVRVPKLHHNLQSLCRCGILSLAHRTTLTLESVMVMENNFEEMTAFL